MKSKFLSFVLGEEFASKISYGLIVTQLVVILIVIDNSFLTYQKSDVVMQHQPEGFNVGFFTSYGKTSGSNKTIINYTITYFDSANMRVLEKQLIFENDKFVSSDETMSSPLENILPLLLVLYCLTLPIRLLFKIPKLIKW